MTNALSDTVTEKPSLTQAIRYRRCLVPGSDSTSGSHLRAGSRAFSKMASQPLAHQYLDLGVLQPVPALFHENALFGGGGIAGWC